MVVHLPMKYSSESEMSLWRHESIILAVIPATSFVVLYEDTSDTQQIILCDTDGVIPESYLATGQLNRYAHFDEFERHLIAWITRTDSG